MSSPVSGSSSSPLAYLNGEFVPLREARLPIWDLGLLQGATVTEALRTFRHVPFRIDEHLSRLAYSLHGIGVRPQESMEQLRHLIEQMAAFNAASLPEDTDLCINLFVTAGESQLFAGGLSTRPGRPTVGISTRLLDIAGAARLYRDGLSLVIPSIRHIPASIIDPRIKYRSRLHWFLADQEVHTADPAAEALLLDLDGFVTETAKGNLFARFGDRVKTPSERTTLAGVSQAFVMELLSGKGIVVERANMTSEELLQADEIIVSNTTNCLVQVTRLNGSAIGGGRPGPLWRTLVSDWSKAVNVDIIGQASS